MITPNNKISYFGFNFIRKSTSCLEQVPFNNTYFESPPNLQRFHKKVSVYIGTYDCKLLKQN